MISRQSLLVLGISWVAVTFGSSLGVRAEQTSATLPAGAPPTIAGSPPAKPPSVTSAPANPPAAKAKLETTTPKTEAAAPSSEATVVVPTAPTGMPRGPSIYDTGRVGQLGVSDSGTRIKQAQERAKPKEIRIEEKASAPERNPAEARPSGGVLNQAVFGRELRPRFALLRDCRIEVARQKRTSANSLPASRLILRWTILPNGSVTDTEVVATSPIDGRVTDCMKRQMSLWSFSPPTGGPAQVERPFKFQ